MENTDHKPAMINMRKINFYLIEAFLIALILIVNPIVRDRLFAAEEVIQPSTRAILWALNIILLAVLIAVIFMPERVFHFAGKYGVNVALSIAVFIISLAAIELALTAYSRLSFENGIFYHNYEFNSSAWGNSDGFRDDEFVREKAEDTKRIFLIGDSFVFGEGNNQNETIDRYLEKMLNSDPMIKYEVYNLGVGGTSPPEYYSTAERFKDYSPDIIIVSLYVDNDIIYQITPNENIKNPILRNSLNFIDSLKIKKLYNTSVWRLTCMKKMRVDFGIDKFYAEKMCKEEINYVVAFAGAAGDVHARYSSLAEFFKNDNTTKKILFDIKELYTDVPFILLINPARFQVKTTGFTELNKLGFVFSRNETIGREIQDEIISWAQSYNISYIDVLPGMKENSTAEYFYVIDDHYTNQGNHFVADAIYEKIQDEGLLK